VTRHGTNLSLVTRHLSLLLDLGVFHQPAIGMSMLDVINTIVPVFLVILLGYFLHAKELLPSPIVGPLNRLVFYLAIPAMIFREISRVSFAAYFSPFVLAATLAPIFMVFLRSR